MNAAALILGIALVVVSLTDLVHTLVTTSSYRSSISVFAPSAIVTKTSFALVRRIARRAEEGRPSRERLLATYGPSLLVLLLAMWVMLQVIGYGLIWWAVGGIRGAPGLGESLYYSGVTFFTVGFGDILPVGAIPRVGVLIEAFSGVVTTALVIGYLPTLYAAYSERERAVMTIDDGSQDRITPTNLVMAWAPDADPAKLNAQFVEWERWVTAVAETHGTAPMLVYFRSHDHRQNWVTALGLLTDAALHAQLIVGSSNGAAFRFLRRSEALFAQLTEGVDLSHWKHAMSDDERARLFADLHRRLTDHGFELLPYDFADRYALDIRSAYAPALEYLIDELLCPRGFWAPRTSIGPAPNLEGTNR